MDFFYRILLVLIAYLVGSIPTSVWISRSFFKIDIRDHGSGNAGATNTFRVLGIKPGIIVFLIDLLKGFAAVNLIRLTGHFIPKSPDFVTYQLVLGAAAVLGHIFPVYVGFKGGKGVATLFGVIFAIAPIPTLIAGGIFIITFLITKYVSLSSLLAGISFPIIIIFIFKTTTMSLVIFSLIIAVMLLLTHQKNIERLVRREESKADFSKLKRKSKN